MKSLIMNCPPKFIACVTALGLFAVSSANAQTAVTGSLGYYTFDVPAGNSAWVCGLVAKNDFAGAMTAAVTFSSPNSTITSSGAGWMPGAFDLHYVEVREGPNEGLVLDVVSNGTDTVVVAGDVSSLLSGTEKFIIRRHTTLNTMLPAGGGLIPFTDVVRLFYPDGTNQGFLYDNATNNAWIQDDFSTVPLDEDIRVYPGQGFLVTATAPASVTIGGNEISSVKVGQTKTSIYGAPAVNLVGLVNPLVASNPNAASVAAFEEHQVVDMGLTTSGFVEFTDIIQPITTTGVINATGGYGLIVRYTPAPAALINSNDFTTDQSMDIIRNGAAFLISPSGLSAGSPDRIYTQPQLHP